MTSKGLVQETMVFAVLAGVLGIFVIILGADASGNTEQIFELLESSALLLAGLIPVIGFYFFYKAWS